jgi:hypothetical protein
MARGGIRRRIGRIYPSGANKAAPKLKKACEFNSGTWHGSCI